MPELAVTYKDLGLIIVFVILVVAGGYLIRALKNLGDALRQVKKLLDANYENFDKVVADLPKISASAAVIAKDAEGIVSALRDEQEMVDETLQNITETVEMVTETVQMVNEDLFSGVKRAVNILANVVGLFQKKKSGQNGKGEDGDGESGERGCGSGDKDATDSAGPVNADAGVDAGGTHTGRKRHGGKTIKNKVRMSRKRRAKQADRAEHISIRIR